MGLHSGILLFWVGILALPLAWEKTCKLVPQSFWLWDGGMDLSLCQRLPQIVLLNKTQHLLLPVYLLPAALLRADGGEAAEVGFQDGT